MNRLASCQNGREHVLSGNKCHRQASLLNALPLLSLAVVSGCATPALWKHTAAKNWCPESFPDQFLAITTTGRQDVIVVFHQFAAVGDKTKHRLVAWNLCQPSSELTVGRHALRQLTNACDRVQVMPSFTSETVPADATPATPGYAVSGPQYEFTVHLDGVCAGPFDLPSTRQDTRLLRRIAILPFSVAADAAIIAAACSAGAGYGSAGPVGR